MGGLQITLRLSESLTNVIHLQCSIVLNMYVAHEKLERTRASGTVSLKENMLIEVNAFGLNNIY